MIVIAHRGNTEGPSELENSPGQIGLALKMGYDVEIDVRYIEGKWYLGHDLPQHEVQAEFLKQNGLWCHAKNIDALYELMKLGIRCFWHQEDDVTLTSCGHLWTYPGKELTARSICVMPENVGIETLKGVAGVCTDFPGSWRADV
jgi:hypothetical protein